MRSLYIFAFLLVSTFCSVASATSLKIDSVYADSIYAQGVSGVTSPESALGKPDGKFAVISGNAPLFDLAFRRHNGIIAKPILIPILPKSTIIIWGRKDKDVDSSAGQMTLYKTDPSGILLYSTELTPFYLKDGINIYQVPDSLFTYMEFSLPGLGTSNGAKSYSIDALALVEDTFDISGVTQNQIFVQHSSVRANYPNPFEGKTTIDYSLIQGGNIEMMIVDMNGIEHGRADLGYQSEGTHSFEFMTNDHGLFFVRLFINGVPSGNPLKIISR